MIGDQGFNYNAPGIVSVFFRFCDSYARILDLTLTALGLSLLFAVTMQVAGRYVPFIPPYLWTLELSNFSLIWAVFIGSILGLRGGRHFLVDIFIGRQLSPYFNLVLKIIYYVVIFTVTYIFIAEGYGYFVDWGLIQSSEITGINLGFLYFSVPFAGISWLVFLIEQLIKDIINNKINMEGKGL